MTALAEALLAAQRQALNGMMKAHTQVLDGTPQEEAFYSMLDSMGCNDKTDSVHLWAALNIIRQTGVESPKPTVTPESRKPGTENEPATDAQMKFLRKLADEKGTVAPDYPLTKKTASDVISEMQAGTYNPDNYTVPF